MLFCFNMICKNYQKKGPLQKAMSRIFFFLQNHCPKAVYSGLKAIHFVVQSQRGIQKDRAECWALPPCFFFAFFIVLIPPKKKTHTLKKSIHQRPDPIWPAYDVTEPTNVRCPTQNQPTNRWKPVETVSRLRGGNVGSSWTSIQGRICQAYNSYGRLSGVGWFWLMRQNLIKRDIKVIKKSRSKEVASNFWLTGIFVGCLFVFFLCWNEKGKFQMAILSNKWAFEESTEVIDCMDWKLMDIRLMVVNSSPVEVSVLLQLRWVYL